MLKKYDKTEIYYGTSDHSILFVNGSYSNYEGRDLNLFSSSKKLFQ